MTTYNESTLISCIALNKKHGLLKLLFNSKEHYQGEFAMVDNHTGFNSFELRQYDNRLMRWTTPPPDFRRSLMCLHMRRLTTAKSDTQMKKSEKLGNDIANIFSVALRVG